MHIKLISRGTGFHKPKCVQQLLELSELNVKWSGSVIQDMVRQLQACKVVVCVMDDTL